jgi:murein DD-endopeptidase MepM/ murein hydrolase activator NlpD
MNRFKKMSFLIALFGLAIMLGMIWQPVSAEDIIIVLDDDVYFSFGPIPKEMEERLFHLYPHWEDFQQTVNTDSWSAGIIIDQASFGGPEYGVNPAVLLVTVGMELNWQVPSDGDLYSLAVQTAKELGRFAVEYDTQEEVQSSYPQIGNQSTYALYRFFGEDPERLVEWKETYQTLFSEDPSIAQVRSLLASNQFEPVIQRPFDQHESSFYVVSSYFDHTYPLYKREAGENKNDLTRFDGEIFTQNSNISKCLTGINCYSGHPAIDYSIPRGVPIFAAASGKLVRCYENWGALFAEHGNGLSTSYLHMDPLEIPDEISCGEVRNEHPSVVQGQVIGYVSNKNDDNDPEYAIHLHFGVGYEANIQEQQNVDPFGWWSPDEDPWAENSEGFESTWLWKGDEAGDGYLTVDNRESQAQLFRHPYGSGDWNRVDRGYKGEAWYAVLNTEAEATATSIHWAIWGTKISTPGNYQIQAYWPTDEGGDTTSGAEYQIYRYLGEDLVISRALADQAAQSETWVVLDEMYFDQGPTVVMLSDVTHNPAEDGKRVYFDAVRWVYVPPTPPPPTSPPPPTDTPTPPPGSSTFTVQINQGTEDAGIEPGGCVYTTTKYEIYIGECDNGTLITSGFRFGGVPIPQGAQILEAYLEFTVDGTYSIPVSVRISGQDSGDALPFSNTDRPTNRPQTSASTAWDITPSEIWSLGNIHRSPELKAVVQEIVSRPDWAAYHGMAFILDTMSSAAGQHRRVIGYERGGDYSGTEHAARLVVTFMGTIPPTPPPSPSPPPPTPTPPPTPIPPPSPPPFPDCIFEWIRIIFDRNSSVSMMEGEVPQSTGTPTINTLSVSERLAQAVDLVDFAPLLYDVRDFLSLTPQGLHYTTLYKEYSAGIAVILIQNEELYNQGYDILESLAPSLQALLDGNGGKATITSDQVFSIQTFLDSFTAEARPALQNAIRTERDRRPLEELIDLSMEEAWNHVNGYNLTWLPPLSNTDSYESKVGSTILVQFRLETLKGEFVEDETVLIQVVNEAGDVILGPFTPSNNPTNGITIQGKKYHLNIKAKDLEPGNYTIEVYYNAVEPGEPAIWNLVLMEK